MVPVVLLLLLHESLAQNVFLCINISSHELNITVNDALISENVTGVKCNSGSVCNFQCIYTTFTNETWFNGSSGCITISDTEITPNTFKYTTNDNITCYLYFCSNSSIGSLMGYLNNNDLRQEELMQIYHLRGSCKSIFDTNSEVKKTFIQAEKQLIHKIMATSKVETDSSENYNLIDLYLNVIKPNASSFNTAGADFLIHTELLPENDISVPEIWMPVNALQSIPLEKRRVGLVSYVQDNHFRLAQENITSGVVRIELLWKRLENLNPPIKMIFGTNTTNIDNGSRLMCHYLDEYDFVWKRDGCETIHEANSSNVTCRCSHTTPFAVLLIREPISEAHWKILSIISYIGCGVSAFFTAVSLVMYTFSRNHKMDFSISIHVSLSGALFLLNTSFMLTELGANMGSEWVCVFIAALIHYSLLCCFTWMAIEALHLYLLLIKVFNTYYKHYLLKLSLAGWGVPGVIVATTLGLTSFYGKTELEMHEKNQTSAICWITDDTFFYSVNLVYFTLIFVFNSGILMAVASNICKMKQVLKNNSMFKAKTQGKSWEGAERFSASCKSGLTLLGLTCLMGTTWGLAFLGSGFVNYPILYLFSILNSFQGFFIFLWICLSVKKQRKRDLEGKLTSTPMRSSATKSE